MEPEQSETAAVTSGPRASAIGPLLVLLGALAMTTASAWSLATALREGFDVPLTPVVVTLVVPPLVAGVGSVLVRRGRLGLGLAVLATLAAAFLPALPSYVGTVGRGWLSLLAGIGLAGLLVGGALSGVALLREDAPRWERGSPGRLVLGLGGGVLLAAGTVLPQAMPAGGAVVPTSLGTLFVGGDPLLLTSVGLGVLVDLGAGFVVGWAVPRRIGAALAWTLAVLRGAALTSNALIGTPDGVELSLGLGWFVGLVGALLFVLVRPEEDTEEVAQVSSSSA